MAKKADKKFQIETKYNRSFSEEFRKSKVKEIQNGHLRVQDLCRLYNLSRTAVYKWKANRIRPSYYKNVLPN